MKAVILLSGGLDSASCLGIAINEGYDCYPLIFSYGQRHSKEVTLATKLCEHYNLKPTIVNIDFLKQFGHSALTDNSIDMPNRENIGGDIPISYVPCRNTIFLSIALSFAECIDADVIFIGVNMFDGVGYPDTLPEYVEVFQRLADKATKKAVEGRKIIIKAPLLYLTKSEIIKEGIKLNIPYHLTTSCYRGGEKACGRCDSCRLRLKGFREAGCEDPIPYEIE